MTAPTFSIIMPVRNRSGIIRHAIASVGKQQFTDYELIIVDDGSTDRLENSVAPFLRDERIRLVRIPHRGVGAARNEGLRLARGTWIAYLDSDNTWDPAYLSRMHAALAASPESRTAYCRFNQFNRLPVLHVPYLWKIGGEPFRYEKLLEENFIDINTFVHARECSNETGPWDETLKRLVDWDFIIRMTARYPPVYIEETLVNYYYQVRGDSISSREPIGPALEAMREKIRGRKKP